MTYVKLFLKILACTLTNPFRPSIIETESGLPAVGSYYQGPSCRCVIRDGTDNGDGTWTVNCEFVEDTHEAGESE